MAVWNCEGKVLSGTGICSGHTAYFSSQGAVEGYMSGKAKGSFTEYSYTRPDKGSINAYAPGSCHVAMPYDATTMCDYVMYRNNDVDARWYYGRVMHREYVNINSTRLWFETDYWLTFNDELKNGIGACLIERTHVKEADDWNGANSSYRYLNPEPYVPKALTKMYTEWNEASLSHWDDMVPSVFMVYATTDESGNGSYDLKTIGGAPNACWTKVCTSLGELAQVINDFNSSFPFLDTSNTDSIVAVTWQPAELSEEGGPPPHFWDTTIPNKGTLQRSDGRPFNNAKCFTFPYMWASAKSPNGEEIAIKFEEFANDGIVSHYTQGAGGVDARYRYGTRQDTSDDRVNMKFVNLPTYPQIPVNSNTFAQWIGSNGMGTAITGLAGALMVAVGVAGVAAAPFTGGLSAGLTANAAAIGTAAMGAGMAGSAINNLNQAANAADTQVGRSSGTSSAVWNLFRVGFYLNMPSLDDLTAVDDFLTVYGYAYNRFAVPNLKVRANWTYVKTMNANITAGVPAEGIQQLQAMLNNGTTFWNVDNCPIGQYRDTNPDA